MIRDLTFSRLHITRKREASFKGQQMDGECWWYKYRLCSRMKRDKAQSDDFETSSGLQ